MTAAGLALAAVAAIVDWWAVWSQRANVESVAKPLVMVAAIIAAIAGIDEPAVRWLITIGLGFGLAGDVLLLPAIDNFIGGLAAFLLGHLAYVLAFIAIGWSGIGWLTVGVVVAAGLATTIGRRIVASSGSLRVPVGLYIAVIVAMVVTAITTGRAPIAGGALLFAASDALLGWDRFVDHRTDRRVFVHLLYHVGQLLIVAGVAWSTQTEF